MLGKLTQPISQANFLQREWDYLFMIDIFPENKKRFGVNLLSVTEKILDIQQKKIK
jgi:outer membrane protein assembly factor BamE (lipoprotein component of BamABCDE complex)